MSSALSFAIAEVLSDSLGASAELRNDAALRAARYRFDSAPSGKKQKVGEVAIAAAENLLHWERRLSDEGHQPFDISLRSRNLKAAGDVRNIVVKSARKEWEVGLSLSEQSDIIRRVKIFKHSDLIGEWLGVPMSAECREEFANGFALLRGLANREMRLADFSDNAKRIYRPMLEALAGDICENVRKDKGKANVFLRNLFGSHDFYRIVEGYNGMRAFNIYGLLGLPIKGRRGRVRQFPMVMGVNGMCREYSEDRIVLHFHHGWQICFRMCRAVADENPSVEMDIRVVGNPFGLLAFHTFVNDADDLRMQSLS